VTDLGAVQIGDVVEDAGVDLGRDLDVLKRVRIVAERLEDVTQVIDRPRDREVEGSVPLKLGSGILDTNHLLVVVVLVEVNDIIVLLSGAILALNVDRSLEHLIYGTPVVFKLNAPGHPRDRLLGDRGRWAGLHGRHSHRDPPLAHPRRGPHHRLGQAQHLLPRPALPLPG